MAGHIREPKALVGLVILIAVAVSSFFLSEEWRPGRSVPFGPELTVGGDHPLCREWLTVAASDFVTGRPLSPAPPSRLIELPGNGDAHFLDLDVYGNGRPLRFVVGVADFNYLYRYSVVAAFRDPTRRAGSIDDIERAHPNEIVDANVPRFLWHLPVPRLIRYDGTVYFASDVPYGDERTVGDKLSIWRLREGAEPETVCELQVVSREGRDPEIPASLSELSSHLLHVVGTSDRCGSLCPKNAIRAAADAAFWRITRQPWSLALGINQRQNTASLGNRAIHVLNYWSMHGAWPYEVTLRIKRTLPRTRGDLIAYYVRQFSMPAREAERFADRALFSFLASHLGLAPEIDKSRVREKSLLQAANALLVAEPPWGSAAEYYEWQAAVDRKRQLLVYQRSLLYGKPADSIGNLSAESKKELSEPEIVLAVRWPHLIKHIVLRNGKSALEETNTFGKTPLMYAAHFNLLESAESLLNFGANPNRQTTKSSPEVGVRIAGRSALMYAAENSDRRMIELLLAHGADRQLQDTDGRRAQDYLRLNTSLSESDRTELAGSLN